MLCKQMFSTVLYQIPVMMQPVLQGHITPEANWELDTITMFNYIYLEL
jgi:hypothetical protein